MREKGSHSSSYIRIYLPSCITGFFLLSSTSFYIILLSLFFRRLLLRICRGWRIAFGITISTYPVYVCTYVCREDAAIFPRSNCPVLLSSRAYRIVVCLPYYLERTQASPRFSGRGCSLFMVFHGSLCTCNVSPLALQPTTYVAFRFLFFTHRFIVVLV